MSRSPLRVALVANLLQDLELLAPIYQRMRAEGSWQPEFWLTSSADQKWPELTNALRGLGAPFGVVQVSPIRDWLRFKSSRVRALVSASETDAAPHANAHRLTLHANAVGIPTYTMQHGFENIGLTFSEPRYDIATTSIAARRIFIWGPAERLHPNVSASTRARVCVVGCPKSIEARVETFPLRDATPIVAVFENLHWDRYSDAYRTRFLDDFSATAEHFANLQFVFKPHPAGRWFTDRFKRARALPENVLVADPRESRWQALSSATIMAVSMGVVTTPSTIAIDAARQDRPVAVAGYDLDLANYSPLSVLRDRGDWVSAIDKMLARDPVMSDQMHRFVEGAVLSGDAVGRILGVIAADIGRRNPA